METAKLKKFAQAARRSLIEQVGSKLILVLKEESPARRELPQVVAKLERELTSKGEEQLIEQVAYTWFNRFCALRFMDVNGYNRIGVLSPADGQFQPEVLAEAKAGHIDEAMISRPSVREKVTNLLNGSTKSHDSQSEAYRLLIAAVCNEYYRIMPYLFERIEDYTELLMPDDLLSDNSILAHTREAMTPEACQDVEIIGWLYQFYISEKKDEVFAGLKKNVKITAANIPAATQLFTPHWIVRYLVENSLGRLWLLNRPQSRLVERMDYYIAPNEPETEFLKITRPEDIRICDPAAGSGHMLTYAFDLLYAIYEEEGYDATEIPALILTHNLTGVEIDDRAGALAAFALAMKAAAKLGRRRFLRMEAKPDICVLQNVALTETEVVRDVASVVGKDLFTDDLRETLGQFEQAKNFGSLIVPKLHNPAETRRVVEARDFSADLLLKEVQERVVAVLRMAEALSSKYHVVVANPPYMGGKGMNAKLQHFAKAKYPDSKSDLFAMFMERALRMASKHGMMAMINMQSWMFLSTYEQLRIMLSSKATLLSMAHLGERAFDTISGAVVSTTAFVFARGYNEGQKADFIRLVKGTSESEKANLLREAASGERSNIAYKASADELAQIPGSPLTYWVNRATISAFSEDLIGDVGKTRRGLQSGDRERFVRFWFEPIQGNTDITSKSRRGFLSSKKKWARLNNGGTFRKWYGNLELVVNWQNDGSEIKNSDNSIVASEHLYFGQAVCWAKFSTASEGYRLHSAGVVPGDLAAYFYGNDEEVAICYFNSKVSAFYKQLINPSLTNNVGDLARIPAWSKVCNQKAQFQNCAGLLIKTHESDWNAYETSWDFTTLPLLQPDHRAETLDGIYTGLRRYWQGMTDEMQRLEEENNRIFIDAYGLQDELTPEVPLKEITLTCNPAYRYGGIKNDVAANEARLRADTMAEFLSYAVGCMFGRYSLDTPGLILANQGETLADYLACVPAPSFMPDEDNVIPMIDFEGDWFEDDISERFKEFLKVTFGEEHFSENLSFIEEAISKDIKKYFVKDFYADHVKRYKKRPIYWLFSSPKGTFNALIYMHRYRTDTISVVLNDYLREFRTKLQARKASYEQTGISASASQKDKTQAIKAIDKINKVLEEVNDYERDILYPLAGLNIEIDLDDGVKANYPKFGKALKKVTGLT